MTDDGDDRVHWHFIRCNTFHFPKFDEFELVCKVLGISDVIWEMSYQWPDDVGQLLGHPISDCSPTGHYEPKGCLLCGSQVAHRTLGQPVPVG